MALGSSMLTKSRFALTLGCALAIQQWSRRREPARRVGGRAHVSSITMMSSTLLVWFQRICRPRAFSHRTPEAPR